MTDLAPLVAPWLALGLLLAAAACAFCAATTRSLVILVLCLWACAAFAAAALLSQGEGEGALALALFGAGLAPTLMFMALTLSARVVKGARRRPAVLAMAGGMLVTGALIWALPDLPIAAPQRAQDTAALFLMSSGLVFVGVVALAGLLGFGERGALEQAGAPKL